MTQRNGSSSVWKRLVAVFAGLVVTGTCGALAWYARAQAAHEKQDGHPVIVERVGSMLKVQKAMQVEQTSMMRDVLEIKGDIKLLLERTDGGRP